MQNALTILLVIKNRALFTSRWMDYANSIELPFKVLIADGGYDQGVSEMLSDGARYPKVDFEYIRYQYDSTYSDYYRKISDALRRIRTPFVAMADNDDFFIVDTLKEAIEFLSKNPDYVSCGGQGAVFWLGPSLQNEDNNRLYGENIDWKCTQASSISGENARGRISGPSFWSARPWFYYDVTRIEHARKQFELVSTLNFTNLALTEDLLQYLTAIAGKTERLKRLFLARQSNSPDTSAAAHEEKYGDLLGRMLVHSWSGEFTKFLESASSWLAVADGISIDEANDCIRSSYRMLIAPMLLSIILDEPSVSLQMPIITSIVRRLVGLPEYSLAKRLVRKAYRRLHLMSHDAVYGKKIFRLPTSNSRRDFHPIAQFLVRRR